MAASIAAFCFWGVVRHPTASFMTLLASWHIRMVLNSADQRCGIRIDHKAEDSRPEQ